MEDSFTGSTCCDEDLSRSSHASLSIVEVPSASQGTEQRPNQPDKSAGPKKSVRFVCDENGCVLGQTRTFEKISKRCHSKVWWTEEEFESSLKSCVQVVNDFQQNHSYLWAVSVLYSTSSSSRKTSKSTGKAQIPGANKRSQNQPEQQVGVRNDKRDEVLDRAYQILLEHSEARGLEMYLSTIAKQIKNRHKRSLLKRKKIPRTPSELRRKSKASSKVSAFVAITIAQLDRQQALQS